MLNAMKTSWRRLAKTFWRRHEDVLKASCKRSWRSLEDVLEDEKLLRWRRLQYVLKTCLEDVLKTCLEDIFKTSWRHILKTSSRCLGGKQNVYWWYLYLTNLNVYLTNLCFTNIYLTNLGQMRHLEPNNFDIRLILKHTSIFIL